MKNNFLVITACGEDKVGIVDQLTQTICDNGCNIEESRMSLLGGQFAAIILISGPWNNIAKLESSLDKLAKELKLNLIQQQTQPRASNKNMMPYQVEVIAMDHPGIVSKLSSFFAQNTININELETETYPAPHTGTPMFSVNIMISIPATLPIGDLRQRFMEYCDDMNLDASLEPTR